MDNKNYISDISSKYVSENRKYSNYSKRGSNDGVNTKDTLLNAIRQQSNNSNTQNSESE